MSFSEFFGLFLLFIISAFLMAQMVNGILGIFKKFTEEK